MNCIYSLETDDYGGDKVINTNFFSFTGKKIRSTFEEMTAFNYFQPE